MKLNKKGMTLLELLISIILIGIVLTFLFQLLNDVKSETDNNNYAYNNQMNRSEIIYTIGKDLNKYTLVGIEDKSANNNLVVNFYYTKNTSKVKATLESYKNNYTDELGTERTKYYLKYTDYNGEVYSWEMKGAEVDNCAKLTYYINSSSQNYYFKLNIPIYNNPLHERNYKDKNNAVDDIEITFSGEKKDLETTNGSYLTNTEAGEKIVGICTN